MAKLTKIEKELLHEIEKEPFLKKDEIPCKRGELEITHKGSCTDPIALFRPQVIICYAGLFKDKEFVAIGGTDEGFDDEVAVASVSKSHSTLIKKVQKWVRRDRWLRTVLPFDMITEVDKGSLYSTKSLSRDEKIEKR